MSPIKRVTTATMWTNCRESEYNVDEEDVLQMDGHTGKGGAV